MSVILPAYNAGEYLDAAVASILNQTYPNLELVVVDDGSTDGSVEPIVERADSRIRVLRQANAGKPAAMNRGIEEARGEYYAVQDADDISHPRRLERQAAYLQENPDVAGVFCGYDVILDGTRYAPTRAPKTPAECARDIAAGQMPGHDPTAMYRLSMVKDFRYSEDLKTHEGLDYILRVGERFPLAVVGDCLYSYRVLWESLSHSEPGKRQASLREVRRRTRIRRGLPPLPIKGNGEDDMVRARSADNNIHTLFMNSVAELINAGQRKEALRNAIACCRLKPNDVRYVKPLVYAIAPARLVNWYRMRSMAKRRAADLERLGGGRTG